MFGVLGKVAGKVAKGVGKAAKAVSPLARVASPLLAGPAAVAGMIPGAGRALGAVMPGGSASMRQGSIASAMPPGAMGSLMGRAIQGMKAPQMPVAPPSSMTTMPPGIAAKLGMPAPMQPGPSPFQALQGPGGLADVFARARKKVAAPSMV